VPIGVQAIIGFVLGASMVTSIYVLITLVVLGVLLVGVFQMNQMKIIEKLQQKIFTRNAFAFAEKIPRFDLKKTDHNYLPETTNRFFDTLNIQKGISKILLDIPTASIQILFGLLLLSFYHPIFIAFSGLLLLILWIILKLTSNNGILSSLQESNYKYAVVSWLEEMARVLKSFKFSQGSHLNLQKTDNRVVGYLTARTKHFKVLLLQYRTLVFFKVAITAAMLIVGTYLLLHQQLNIGEFIAAEIVILTVISAIEKLISSLESVYDVVTGLEKIASVIEKPLEKDGKLLLSKTTQGLAITMKDFSFFYQNGIKALHEINIAIPANSTVCVNGKEGSGKSTLLKMLTGSYADFSGSILINNIPINNYSLENLRSHTGVLLNQQDVFEGTIWENISMGKEIINIEKIVSMAEELGIAGFLDTLNEGFETLVDPTGNRLPNNVIRKILLLRAFTNQPKLLLLEHPWEGLQEHIQLKIKDYLLNRKNKSTVFIACEDEQFAQQCDYCLTIENGTLIHFIKNKLN
jgi:ABC-type bacteriocin/lantibiotic exporter with double-glycine peptidase domain